MIRRSLAECEGPVLRSRLLPAAAEIALAAGDPEAAREANDELRAIGTEFGSVMLKACASRGAGAVYLHDGDATAALIQLRAAFRAFNELDARDELARTRLLIAEACRALGDEGTADLEAAAANAALAFFCKAGEPALVDEASDPGLPDGLTQRERDVLLLLARGKTNRVIGQDLFISEKTVASHVSHIFTKLGVTSRSAATAYAYDHGLI